MAGALAGLTVIALEQAVAAPLATSRLADAGARVIKLERPDGDFARHYDQHAAGHSSYFVWLNRGKLSCRVDLRREDDRALVRRMVGRADVFVQNLGPGATERLGLDSATLRAANPRLITCDISGYASGTPHASRKAYDLMIQAEAGLAAITGSADSGPSRVGISVCDIVTGLTAHAQILEALVARGMTGEGRAIALSLFDVAAELMNIPYIAARNGGVASERMGLAHPLIAPYGAYRTANGLILLAVQSDREWDDFCAHVLNEPSLAEDARFASNPLRVRNRTEMNAVIEPTLAVLTTDATIERLTVARIAYGVVSDMADLIHHSALQRTWTSVDGTAVELVAAPAIVDGARAGSASIPVLGEHDTLLRAEFSHL